MEIASSLPAVAVDVADAAAVVKLAADRVPIQRRHGPVGPVARVATLPRAAASSAVSALHDRAAPAPAQRAKDASSAADNSREKDDRVSSEKGVPPAGPRDNEARRARLRPAAALPSHSRPRNRRRDFL